MNENKQKIACEFKNKNDLARAYMPFVDKGGLFIATDKALALETRIEVSLLLPDVQKPVVFTGKIVWVTPATTADDIKRKPGIGVQLTGIDGSAVRERIESIVGTLTEGPTDTL